MKKVYLIIVLFSANRIFAQTTINRDPEIEQMVSEVSADSLKSYTNTLVAFGTRSTLSTQSDKTRGIGAARIGSGRISHSLGGKARGSLSAAARGRGPGMGSDLP